ncbi:hypothetical protein ACHAQJ_005221 [Trichoderma viride]
MARYRAMRRPSLANLVFLAGTASGALLTLSNFEGLGSPASLQCLYAYNTPIRGCIPSDFAKGATCSESCIEGLQAVQFTVRSLCANVNAASNPLLKQIQHEYTTNKHNVSVNFPSGNDIPNVDETNVVAITTFVKTPEHIKQCISFNIDDTAYLYRSSYNEQASSSSEEPSKPTRPPNVQPGSGGGSPFDFVAASTAMKFNIPGSSIKLAITVALTTLTLI